MTIRFATSAFLALVVTCGLFLLMEFLISQPPSVSEARKHRVIEFVRLKEDSSIMEKERKLPDKPEPEEQPPPPELDFSTPDDASSDSMSIAASGIDMGVNLTGGLNMGVGPSDSDVAPLVRVLPVYPARAQERGIEGHVVVEFTIATDGTVKDARVLQSEPSRIFDRSALRAIRKWKYKPKMEDGIAVERPGIQVRMPFELEK